MISQSDEGLLFLKAGVSTVAPFVTHGGTRGRWLKPQRSKALLDSAC